MSDVCRKPCKDAGDVIAGMIAMVNGAAVLEYGNHLPFSVCLNEDGRLIADMGYPEPVAKPRGFASSQ